MNTENNRIIAEFMGLEEDPIFKEIDIERKVLGKPAGSPMYKLSNGTIANLQYHFSWDWLIPVIELCRERQYFGSQRLISNIDKSLLKLDLIATYRNTVDFIKEYNEHLKL